MVKEKEKKEKMKKKAKKETVRDITVGIFNLSAFSFHLGRI